MTQAERIDQLEAEVERLQHTVRDLVDALRAILPPNTSAPRPNLRLVR